MGLQLMWLLFIFLICFGLSQSLVAGLLEVMGVSLSDMTSGDLSSGKLNIIRGAQIMMTFGAFALPGLVFSYMKGRDFSFLDMKGGLIFLAVLVAGLIALLSYPTLAFLKQINDMLVMPESLAWLETMMRSAEDSAEQMTRSLLNMNGIGELLLTMVTAAVMPAICEEILFRGGLQKLLVSWMKNPHVAIWLSGAIFSFIHFQFYGFLPRMFLGALFGYLFYWSGNLWYPIIAHFVNNGSQVLLAYLYDLDMLETDIETVEQVPLPAVLFSAVALILLTALFYRIFANRNKEDLLASQ